jgi:HK97 family phage portal protein
VARRRWWRRDKQEAPAGSKSVEFTPALTEFLRLYEGYSASLSTIYRTQPAVRTVVDFLARNIAQLNVKCYEKASLGDRREAPNHPAAQLIQRPNLTTSRYAMLHGTVSDLAIYDNAYWRKLEQGRQRQLVRIPPWAVTPFGDSMLVVQGYRLSDGTELRRDQVIHFHGYNPDDPRMGFSPLESLRRLLAEESAAGKHRENFWRNAARQDGVIERPVEAPQWSDIARKRFREDWQNALSGETNAGKTAILEEGMKWNASAFSPKDAEFIAGRKLTREEVARAYHIPLPMVGILDHATFSNIREQHKQLYQDTLGPWLAMFEQELALQLLPWFGEFDGKIYFEFNIEEKLQGSFEEQTEAISKAVGPGVAWITRNEARRIRNLPAIDDPGADELIIPSNVTVGSVVAPEVVEPIAPAIPADTEAS